MSATTAGAVFSSTVFNLEEFQTKFHGTIYVGFFLAFFLGFGMGANDVANAFGTSVGSGSLTLFQAYFLATIFETLGSILVGYNVIDTMRKQVVDVNVYTGAEGTLLLGQIAILGGSSIWLLIATIVKLPISTTHSIIGATLGFSLVSKWIEGVQWMTLSNVGQSFYSSFHLHGFVFLFYIQFSFVLAWKKFRTMQKKR